MTEHREVLAFVARDTEHREVHASVARAWYGLEQQSVQQSSSPENNLRCWYTCIEGVLVQH